jgi:iron complex transport system substrate-binding protein
MTSRSTDWINASAALLAVGLSTYAALVGAPHAQARAAPRSWAASVQLEPVSLPDGTRALADATGALIRLDAYHRIASGSLLADPLLLKLCSPENIIAFSARAPLARDAYRYAGKASVDATRRLEHLLELKPDLVLVNSLGEHAWVQRLRDSGLVVFDLGPMWGVQTFMHSAAAIGWLVGHPEAAEELNAHFMARLESIARHVPAEARRVGLYVGVQGSQMYGGTRGSSFHDVLSYAGLVDAAAKEFQGWPTYTPEILLTLDPEIIVTQTGMRASLCGASELGRLKACHAPGAVIEVEPALLNDAGLGILDAAELVHRAAYPEAARP